MQPAPVPTPAGDIGNHVVPEAIVILTGIVALLAVAIRLLARYMMKRFGIPEILLIISMVSRIALFFTRIKTRAQLT